MRVGPLNRIETYASEIHIHGSARRRVADMSFVQERTERDQIQETGMADHPHRFLVPPLSGPVEHLDDFQRLSVDIGRLKSRGLYLTYA